MQSFNRLGQYLLLAAVAVWVPVAYGEGSQTEATVWLEKMARALKEQNYDGIFTFMRGGESNTMQIAHKVKDGHEIERLFQLNGEKLEIIRHDREVVCHHEKSDHIDLDHHVRLGPFSPSFGENLQAFQNLYRFSLHGEGRIAGRPAIKLAISPANKDRYGYRLWLDKETGLLLQSQLIDIDSRKVREVFQFSTIEIGDTFDDNLLVSTLTGETVDHRLLGEVVAENKKPVWRVAWLPRGFKAVQVQGSDRLHFTDGLATFSVFIEPGDNPQLPVMSTQVGGTVIVSRRVGRINEQITVVGEVPAKIANRIAESVEPVIY